MKTTRIITLAEAQRMYSHRFTMEHVPAWAKKPMGHGRYYAPQFRTDLEWYENTVFPGEGCISKRSRYCETTGQTWPLGTSLDAPYVIGQVPA